MLRSALLYLSNQPTIFKFVRGNGLARNFAGVHWRSDYWESLKLGEQVALNFLRETVMTYNENAYFTIRRLDGTQVQITKAGFE